MHLLAESMEQIVTLKTSHPEPATENALIAGELFVEELESRLARERQAGRLRRLWTARVLLFRAAAAGLILSTLIAFLIPKRYTSTTLLMPPDNPSGAGLALPAALSNQLAGVAGLAGNVLGAKNTSDLFAGILASRTLQDSLVQQFGLTDVYGTRRSEDARARLAERTEISVDRKSQIMTIAVTDGSPQRAAAMARAYVAELNHLVADLSTSSARRERMFLEGRLQSAGQDLENAEKDFSEFASKNTAIDIQEQGKAMVESAAALDGQLIAAQSELEGLRQIYADENVRVRAVEARIAELRNQLQKMGGKGESEGVSAAGTMPSDSLYPSMRRLPLLGVTYEDLYRREKVQETVFETLTQEHELAKLQEVKEIPVVKVLDEANVPERKSFPPRLMILLSGTAVAFSAGVAWVFARAMWERADPDDPRKALALEVAGAVAARLPWFLHNGARPLSVASKNGDDAGSSFDAGERAKDSG